MDGFGDDPLSIFVNVKQVSEGMSQNMMVPSGFDAVIPLLDYVTLRGDNEEMELKIMLKNQDQNVLKQVVDDYKDLLKQQMQGV
jgi:hypothetical protein